MSFTLIRHSLRVILGKRETSFVRPEVMKTYYGRLVPRKCHQPSYYWHYIPFFVLALTANKNFLIKNHCESTRSSNMKKTVNSNNIFLKDSVTANKGCPFINNINHKGFIPLQSCLSIKLRYSLIDLVNKQ